MRSPPRGARAGVGIIAALVLALVAVMALRLMQDHGSPGRVLRGKNNLESRWAEYTMSAHWNATVARPFELWTLARLRRRFSFCAMRRPRGKEDAVYNIAVARTGSETVATTLRQNGHPAHHNHDCTLDKIRHHGCLRVIASIRDPVARIVSGYQRRQSEGVTKNLLKEANVRFSTHFGPENGTWRLDRYVDALRDPRHALHAPALAVTYGPQRQSFMLPLVEYYGFSPHLQVDQNLTVRFLCTKTLSEDFKRVGADWGLTRRTPRAKVQRNHASPIASDSAAGKQHISDENRAWIEATYKGDLDLYRRVCKHVDASE